MTPAHEMIYGTSPAMLFGAAGLAGQMAWPLLRDRRRILTMQLGIACAYATQYALLGERIGAIVCLTGATQTTIALIAGDDPRLRYLGLVFVPAVIALGLATWSGPATAFAITACALVMLGRVQRDTLRMRAIQLSATPFSLTYDASVSAYPAMAGALVSAAIAATALRREWLARKEIRSATA